MNASVLKFTRRTRAGLSAVLIALIGSLVALPFAAPAPVRAAANIIYVNAATGDDLADDAGTSWDTPYETLQTALALANNGDEIWVAAGTYYPDDGFTLIAPPDDPRAIAFLVKSDIDIYGGFPASGDPGWGDRDWETHVTILSGDIDENDTANPVTDPATQIVGENAYHVVVAVSNAELNGFTITAGEAEGDSDDGFGGGMYSGGSSPTLTNVTFSGNQASVAGGGMYNEQSSPTLTNVTFENNEAGLYGGGMYNDQSSPTLTNVRFQQNTAERGGGMRNYDNSSPTLTNVTFSGNQASASGGGMYNGSGMYNDQSSPTLTDVTFSGNQAGYGGGGMHNDQSSPTLTDVTFSGNQATSVGGGMYNDQSSPTLTNVTFSGNQATSVGGVGGGMYNYISNLVLTNVTFSGNQASVAGGGMYNNSSSPTLTNVTFSGNSADTNGGGMDNYSSNPTLTNVTFSGNSADTNGGGMHNDQSSPTLTNVTISGSSAGTSGGGMYNSGSNPTIQNSIIWGNAANSGPQVFNDSSTPSFAYSLVEGSGGSSSWDTALGTDGGNNLDSNPLFIAPVDASEAPTTAGDYRLGAGSPAIDAGDNSADLDAGGSGTDTISAIATDLGGYARIVGGTVDLGAYEAGPALVIAKTAAPITPRPGDTITYTLTINNGGELDTSSTIITDTIPAGLTFVPNSLEIDGTPVSDPALPTLADGQSIAAGSSLDLSFRAIVDASLPVGTVITNTASVSAEEDATVLDSSVVVTVTVPAIAVSVAPSTNSAEVGDIITYTYRLTNTGNAPLDPVVATDDVLGPLSLPHSSLAPGAVITATHSYTPTAADLPGPITNTVAVTGTWSYDGDTGEVSDTASTSVEVTSSPAIAVSVASDASSAEAGDTITYSYRVTNTGNVPLDPVVAVDTLGSIALDASSLASGAATDGTLTYTVQQSDPLGPLTTTVTVTGTTVLGTDVISAASATVQITDTTAPAAPVVTSATETNDPYPTISGTAEAGVTITLTIDLGSGASVTYETTANGDGTWSIDLATATPTDGALPDGGLAPGTYPLTVTATDAAGNTSAPANATLTITSGTTLYLPLIAR